MPSIIRAIGTRDNSDPLWWLFRDLLSRERPDAADHLAGHGGIDPEETKEGDGFGKRFNPYKV